MQPCFVFFDVPADSLVYRPRNIAGDLLILLFTASEISHLVYKSWKSKIFINGVHVFLCIKSLVNINNKKIKKVYEKKWWLLNPFK